MSGERSLLERLAHPDPPGSARLEIDVNRLKDSVVNHLKRMLNSRHGIAPAQPDYGIPDLNEFMHAFPDSITPMRQALQQSIEKYEPRLRNVSVAWVAPDPDDPASRLNVRFEITARLVSGGREIPVTFATDLGPSSRLDVSEL